MGPNLASDHSVWREELLPPPLPEARAGPFQQGKTAQEGGRSPFYLHAVLPRQIGPLQHLNGYSPQLLSGYRETDSGPCSLKKVLCGLAFKQFKKGIRQLSWKLGPSMANDKDD